MGDFALRVQGLGKQYRLGGGARHDTLRDAIVGRAKSLFAPGGRGSTDAADAFWALRDVGFDIRRGESVGVIGLNGAGKSTLLKILARIVTPTTGSARLSGRVGALLEVGTGFHGELTGRENVYLYGAILGMTRAEIASKFDTIVDFAEVAAFIDTPVKRYSSGMYVRLAFAVAAHLEPEILFVDEVLSVGDLPFQRKCMAFAKRRQSAGATVLFVSHNMFSIKTMCNRALYLRGGRLVHDGAVEEGIARYERDCRLAPLGWSDGAGTPPAAEITDIAILGSDGSERAVFDHGERMTIRLAYRLGRGIRHPNVIVALVRSDGVACCNFSTTLDGVRLGSLAGGALELTTPPIKLVADSYTVHVIVREDGFQDTACAQIGGAFHVRDELLDRNFGVFHERGTWRVSADRSDEASGAGSGAVSEIEGLVE